MNIRAVLAITPVIPILIIESIEHAVPMARALCNGGLCVLEITLRTPCALQAIEQIRAVIPDAIVGAGTLTRRDDFIAASKAGAQFGVSPGWTSELADTSRSVGLPFLPGVMTASELISARSAGFDTLKLFPAEQAGGIGMLKALGAPFPDVLFCPTGGITRKSAPAYLALSNVTCVGGSWIAPRELLANEDWGAIEALAKDAFALRPAR